MVWYVVSPVVTRYPQIWLVDPFALASSPNADCNVQVGREELRDLGIKLQQSDKLLRARAEELQVLAVFEEDWEAVACQCFFTLAEFK